jgi:hypothetical protein
MPPTGNSEIDWTAADSLCMQRGFRDDGWDYTTVDGRLINKIIKDSISKNPPVYGRLKKFFSSKDGGTKKNNNTIYGHYKTEASEYITATARRGVDLRSGTCLPWSCLLLLLVLYSHFCNHSLIQRSLPTIPVHVFREVVRIVPHHLLASVTTKRKKLPKSTTKTGTQTFKTLQTRSQT